MVKQLRDVLKAAHDTIKGIRPSKVTPLSVGSDPHVDLEPKGQDEQEFIAKHSVRKWDAPANNSPEMFNGSNIKYSLKTPENSRMGNTEDQAKASEINPNPFNPIRPRKVKVVGEEVENIDESKDKEVKNIENFKYVFKKHGYTYSDFNNNHDGSITNVNYKHPSGHKMVMRLFNIKNRATAFASEDPSNTPHYSPESLDNYFKKLHKVHESVENIDELTGKGALYSIALAHKKKREEAMSNRDIDSARSHQKQSIRAMGMMSHNAAKSAAKEVLKVDNPKKKFFKGPKAVDVMQKANEEVELNLEEKSVKHRVSVTVSDPDHHKESSRKVKNQKFVRVKADNKEEAIEKAKTFYKNAGYKVHDAEYHSALKEENIDETLTKKDDAGKWIDDFVHSKNPKFDDKSKEKRKQMALAAYYAKQKE